MNDRVLLAHCLEVLEEQQRLYDMGIDGDALIDALHERLSAPDKPAGYVILDDQGEIIGSSNDRSMAEMWLLRGVPGRVVKTVYIGD